MDRRTKQAKTKTETKTKTKTKKNKKIANVMAQGAQAQFQDDGFEAAFGFKDPGAEFHAQIEDALLILVLGRRKQ